MHRPGHCIALEPARALLDPGQRAAVRLFPGNACEQLCPVTAAGQADAQIGVFGDVMRIPAAQFLQRLAAEEQRGAAQGHHKAHARNPGQHGAKPGRVFDGETARQPVRARVVIVQNALQAGDFGAGIGEMAHHDMQLFGFGHVFGVIDPDHRSAAEVQRIVQRARLGLDRTVRDGHNPHPARQAGPGQGIPRGVIVFLDHQQDIQQLARIVQPPEPADQSAGDVALLEQRHHDRHDG